MSTAEQEPDQDQDQDQDQDKKKDVASQHRRLKTKLIKKNGMVKKDVRKIVRGVTQKEMKIKTKF